MRIEKLGEFGLIDLISRRLKHSAAVMQGIGDDCAILPFDRKNFLLLTCDMLVEGIDFTLRDKPNLVGSKSMGCCLSDIAACAGLPRYAQISLGLSPGMPVSRVKQLYQGIILQAKKFKVKIVGGDISQSDKLIIDVSLVGVVERKYIVRRSGAKKGDIIFVSGKLGGSIHRHHLTFTPRVKEARYLVKNYKINSMIDISDGLIQDLGHILKQSGQGAIVYKDLIPLSADARSFNQALFMGEDFELLFTLAPSQAKRLISSKKNKQFSPIGEITDMPGSLIMLDKQGKEIRLASCGFRHF
ncbi:MAG: thiamine-phosphate kinase [Candidatus Omnitrophota bacterium]|jgi:thiamine-monophosphate kinase